MVDFLVKGKGFDEGRVRNAAKRIRNTIKQKGQKRMEDFFGKIKEGRKELKTKRKIEESKSKKKRKTK